MDVIVIESKAFEELIQRVGDIVQQKIGKELETVIVEVTEKVEEVAQKIEMNRKIDAIGELQMQHLTPEEACQILKCSKRSLHYYKENGSLKYTKQNGKLIFKLSDLQDFLEAKGTNEAITGIL